MNDLLPFNDPRYIAEPYDTWARLRDEAPVYWCRPMEFWAITRYDDVLEVLHDPARFSSEGGPTGRQRSSLLPRLPLLQDDPPHHDRLRRILSKAFAPKITSQREQRVRQIADGLIADLRRRLAEGENADLVRAFTSPLPVNVIAEILGIPSELQDRLRMWNATTSVTGAVELAEAHRPETMREMYETLTGLLEERRRNRRDDLFSALIEASEHDENPLRPDELVGLCQLLWNAGNETTTNLLSNVAVVLQERPDLLGMLRAQPQKIPAMVDEFLRLHTPINCLARTANEDLELRGQKVRKDDVLMVMFAAANRDPRHFERAAEFDPDRRPNDHVAFSPWSPPDPPAEEGTQHGDPGPGPRDLREARRARRRNRLGARSSRAGPSQCMIRGPGDRPTQRTAMKWTRRGPSRNLEDRRGQRTRLGFPMGRGAGVPRGRAPGLSLGGILLLLGVAWLLGINPLALLDGLSGPGPVSVDIGSDTSPGGAAPGSAGSAHEEEMVEFVSFVLDDAQAVWSRMIRDYSDAKLVLFRGATDTGCGFGEAAMGPFYCPHDQKVYIDLAFYEELRRRFGAPGDMAQAYVLAHEIGHHVQNVTGTEARMREAQRRHPEEANEYSIRLELQADCYAGVWARSTQRRDLLEAGDVEEAMRAAAAVGDDQIQKMSTGRVVPEQWTHGSSEMRVRWFRRGFERGDPGDCDSFAG